MLSFCFSLDLEYDKAYCYLVFYFLDDNNLEEQNNNKIPEIVSINSRHLNRRIHTTNQIKQQIKHQFKTEKKKNYKNELYSMPQKI